MLDVLAKIYDESGAFLGAEYTLFDGDQRFITAVGLRFATICPVFRAMPDDDSLAVTVGRLEPDPHETLIDTTHFAPWAACVGYGIRWHGDSRINRDIPTASDWNSASREKGLVP
jgi:hypothetical protein